MIKSLLWMVHSLHFGLCLCILEPLNVNARQHFWLEIGYGSFNRHIRCSVVPPNKFQGNCINFLGNHCGCYKWDN